MSDDREFYCFGCWKYHSYESLHKQTKHHKYCKVAWDRKHSNTRRERPNDPKSA